MNYIETNPKMQAELLPYITDKRFQKNQYGTSFQSNQNTVRFSNVNKDGSKYTGNSNGTYEYDMKTDDFFVHDMTGESEFGQQMAEVRHFSYPMVNEPDVVEEPEFRADPGAMTAPEEVARPWADPPKPEVDYVQQDDDGGGVIVYVSDDADQTVITAEEYQAYITAKQAFDEWRDAQVIKATEIVSISLKNKTSIADFMIIANGNSSRHIQALSEIILEMLKKKGIENCQLEGRDSKEWKLIDAKDIIIHIFHPEKRKFYNLERMWSELIPKERLTI